MEITLPSQLCEYKLCVCVCVCVHVCVCVRVCSLSHVGLFATPWTVVRRAPLNMGFSSQECWSGLPFPPPADLPNPGVGPMSPASAAMADRFFATESPGKPISYNS